MCVEYFWEVTEAIGTLVSEFEALPGRSLSAASLPSVDPGFGSAHARGLSSTKRINSSFRLYVLIVVTFDHNLALRSAGKAGKRTAPFSPLYQAQCLPHHRICFLLPNFPPGICLVINFELLCVRYSV